MQFASAKVHVRVRKYTHVVNTLFRIITYMAACITVRSRSARMPRKANEIVVEWLESKDCGKRHRVNVKHILGKLAEVAVGIEVIIKLNSRCYRAKVVDLLEWTPPQKKRPAKRKETTQQGSKQVCCFLKIRRLFT